MASPTGSLSWQCKRSFEETNWRMLQDGTLCDVTFVVGTDQIEEVKAHRFMLSSRSPVFYAMFCGSLAESSNTIAVPDVEPGIFQELLRFIYTEDCSVNEVNVMPLLYSAKKYEQTRLTQKCREYLNTQISVDNVCIILQHAHTFDEGDLVQTCLDFVLSYGEDVLKSDGFSFLSKEILKKIIESDDLNAYELSIYNACKKWAIEQCKKISDKQEYKPSDLRAAIDDVVHLIRFPAMSFNTFSGHVSKDQILTPEETTCVFQSISEGSTENFETPFASEKRKGVSRRRITIIRCDLNKRDFWNQEGAPDVLNFRVSHRKRLLGVHLFTPRETGTLRGKISLQYGSSTLASKSNLEIVYKQSKYSEEVLFDNAQILEPGKEYTLYAELSGPDTYGGSNGQTYVSLDSFVVSFSDNEKSFNGTSVNGGQIYSLIFFG